MATRTRITLSQRRRHPTNNSLQPKTPLEPGHKKTRMKTTIDLQLDLPSTSEVERPRPIMQTEHFTAACPVAQTRLPTSPKLRSAQQKKRTSQVYKTQIWTNVKQVSESWYLAHPPLAPSPTKILRLESRIHMLLEARFGDGQPQSNSWRGCVVWPASQLPNPRNEHRHWYCQHCVWSRRGAHLRAYRPPERSHCTFALHESS